MKLESANGITLMVDDLLMRIEDPVCVQPGLVTAQVATISVTSLVTLILFRFVRPTLLVSCMKALTTRCALRSRLNAMAFKEL